MFISLCGVVTYPEVGGCKSGRSRDVGGGGGVGVEGIDVGQQGAHHCRHPWQHVLRGQAREMAVEEKKRRGTPRRRETGITGGWQVSKEEDWGFKSSKRLNKRAGWTWRGRQGGWDRWGQKKIGVEMKTEAREIHYREGGRYSIRCIDRLMEGGNGMHFIFLIFFSSKGANI